MLIILPDLHPEVSGTCSISAAELPKCIVDANSVLRCRESRTVFGRVPAWVALSTVEVSDCFDLFFRRRRQRLRMTATVIVTMMKMMFKLP